MGQKDETWNNTPKSLLILPHDFRVQASTGIADIIGYLIGIQPLEHDPCGGRVLTGKMPQKIALTVLLQSVKERPGHLPMPFFVALKKGLDNQGAATVRRIRR